MHLKMFVDLDKSAQNTACGYTYKLWFLRGQHEIRIKNASLLYRSPYLIYPFGDIRNVDIFLKAFMSQIQNSISNVDSLRNHKAIYD